MRTVFFDIDTQMDFLYPAGALSVPGAEFVEDATARLNRYAAAHGIPVISTMDAHTENDPEFQQWPAHCVAGTLGQRKPTATLLEKRIVVPNTPGEVTLEGVEQFLLEKQTFSCFSNTRLEKLLEALKPDRVVVYGVVTEICVRFAAMGLLDLASFGTEQGDVRPSRDREVALTNSLQVELVTDAMKELNPTKQGEFFKEFQSRGGKRTTLAEIVSR